MNVRRVYTREAAAVPIDHIFRIPVDLPACSFNTPTGAWTIGPKEIRPGLLLSRTLVNDKDDYPAIQLFNVSGKSHFLSAGLNLGLAELGSDITSLSPPADSNPAHTVPTTAH